jgi:hypothetical protein
MTEQLNNIIFWVSFVGIAIFIVQSIQSTIVLRLSKSKEFKAPDMLMTTISVTLAIMFVALAISNNLKLAKALSTPTPSITPIIELHKPVGKVYEWNPATKKIDTIEIYKRK